MSGLAVPGDPEQSGQRIWPYTDLLLHDLGAGLDDGRHEGGADGREWLIRFLESL